METWREELFLKHHGVLGQKWGVKNGPPYPLQPDNHSVAEKKAGWRMSLKSRPSEPSEKPSKRNHQDATLNVKKSFDRRRVAMIARNVALGSVAVAVGLATVYAAKRYSIADEFSKNDGKRGALHVALNSAAHKRGTVGRIARQAKKVFNTDYAGTASESTRRLSHKLATTSISELSDDDLVIKGRTEFQRIIKTNDLHGSIMREKAATVMYAAYEDNDKRLYYRNIGGVLKRDDANSTVGHRPVYLKNYAMTLRANKDIRIASERKRIQSFVDLLKDDSNFRKAFESDLQTANDKSSRSYNRHVKNQSVDAEDLQRYYEDFQYLLGDWNSKSRGIYFRKLTDMGYNAVIDDNDAGAFSSKPVILLNASEDVVIEGVRRVNALGDFMNTMAISLADIKKTA